jgi:16S rRNA (adenine1518-N6/adenine1519-N6)-dimethyltransferase
MAIGSIAREALEKSGFRFTHSLGQNFILDDTLTAQIADAAGVGPGDRVLEIGAGAGVMTRTLADRGAKVVALEIDRTLEPVLQEVLKGSDAEVEFADALKCDLVALTQRAFGDQPFDVVANLPYYITADVFLLLVKSRLPIQSMTVMVQKEAAERITASPGQKNWCALSATVQHFGTPAVLLNVPPEAFTPRPHVESVLLRVEMHRDRQSPENEAMFLKVVQAAFAMRRKTLVNNLMSAFSMPREEAEALVTSLGHDLRVRGEALAPDALSGLSDALKNANRYMRG